MGIAIGFKQPDPRHIRVTIERKEETERPINVWFDDNIIGLTKEQASILQWKLKKCLDELGFHLTCPYCHSCLIDRLTEYSELSRKAQEEGEIYRCRHCQNAFRKEGNK